MISGSVLWKEFLRGIFMIIFLRRAAPWDMGQILTRACMESDKAPIGMYTPVTKPMRVPSRTLTAE